MGHRLMWDGYPKHDEQYQVSNNIHGGGSERVEHYHSETHRLTGESRSSIMVNPVPRHSSQDLSSGRVLTSDRYGAHLVIRFSRMADGAKDWRFPVVCPTCMTEEGTPIRVAERPPLHDVEVWVRCETCAFEWKITAAAPLLFLKPKRDRRTSSG